MPGPSQQNITGVRTSLGSGPTPATQVVQRAASQQQVTAAAGGTPGIELGFTLDAFIVPATYFNLDAVVRWTQSSSFGANAVLVSTRTGAFSANARIRPINQANTSVMVAGDNASTPATVAANANAYNVPATGDLVLDTTIANGTFTVRTAGTFSRLTARVVSGNRNASTPLIDFYVNGSPASQQILLAPGGSAVAAGEYSDTANYDHVNAGDTVAFHVFGGTSGNANWTFTMLSVSFTPDNISETVTFLAAAGSLAYTVASETSYRQPGSGAAKTTTQAQGEWRIRLPDGTATFRNLYVFVSANARTTATAVAINGATGSGTAPNISIAGSSGATTQEDTGNSVVANDGDQISFRVVTSTGTGTLTTQLLVVEAVTNRTFFIVAASTAGASLASTGLTMPPGGLLAGNATESRSQVSLGLVRRISHFTFYVSAGTGSFQVRVNGADSNLNGTLLANNWVADTTDTVITATSDLIGYRFTRTTTATAFVLAITLRAPETASSFSVDAVIRRVTTGAFSANAVMARTLTTTLTLDARIVVIRLGSFSANAVFGRTTTQTTTLNAWIPYAAIVWTTPTDTTPITVTPSYAFLIPPTSRPVHFQLQLDKVATFNGPSLRTLATHVDQTGWEYWNGSAWTAIPATGVPAAYVGNEARYTVQTPFAQGEVWYRRIRAGAG